jgi:biopolymer transport protein ExbD
MKFNKAQVEDVDVAIDMSAMIDMVFLLLIFFIVASVVNDMDKPNVELSAATSAKVSKDTTGRVQVSIDQAGLVYFGDKEVTIEQLKTKLTDELKIDPNTRVFMRTDKNVPYRVTKKVMKACADVDALDLIFATYESGGGE